MGYLMVFDNTEFSPKAAGWRIGQVVHVTCVGGGGGGGAGSIYGTNVGGNGGEAGYPGEVVAFNNFGGNSMGGYGAGGGGGGSYNYSYAGKGGGSGYVNHGTFVAQNLNNIPVTIGARGLGGIYPNNNGGNGGTTSFGTILFATGGGGGGGTAYGSKQNGIGRNSTNNYTGAAGYIPFNNRGQSWGFGGTNGRIVENSSAIGYSSLQGEPGTSFPGVEHAGLGLVILEW